MPGVVPECAVFSKRFVILPALAVLFSFSALAATKSTWSNMDDYPLCPSGKYAQCWQSSSSLGGGQSQPEIFGPTAVTSPSLDGSSGMFTVGSNGGYGNGLWWANTICCVAGVSAGYKNFTYDLYFYIADPSVAQALEFDVNQTISNQAAGTSVRYVFGTQCVTNGQWQVWNEGVGWGATGVSCSVPAARWNHLVWSFQRTSSGQVYFVSLTFNGQKSYINKKYGPRNLNVLADDLNGAYQMDTNSSGAGYSTWLDNVVLKAW